MADKVNAAPEKKRGPEFLIKLPPAPGRLRRDTPFMCNIRFRNDLPEIPCDPKMLLPPLNQAELGAFSLTSLEREMKRDMLFEPDLGIPITVLDIDRYTIPYAGPHEKPALHPKDAELLKDDDAAGPLRARLRGSAAELSWLMRTKYITNESTEQARRQREQARRAAAEAAEAEGAEGAIAAIERSFEAAQQMPLHPSNPALEPVEILPVFPDDLLEGRTYVLALFDNDPAADLDRLGRLSPEERAQITQSAQLKSFAHQRADGRIDRFVAYLVPKRLRPAEGLEEAGPSGSIPAEALQTDYEWVREYDQQVKVDAKDATYLFRFAGDHVAYHDLNTKLLLRKRKRQQYALDEEEGFVPPGKVVLRLPGNTDLEDLEEEEGAAAAAAGAAGGRDAGGGDSPPPPARRRLSKAGGPDGGGRGEVGGGGALEEGLEDSEGEGGGSPVAQQQQEALRDVFGSDDDDL